MNGNWYTATYVGSGNPIYQNPNYPTRFRMTDGTTLGATADWTYGPAADAYDVIANTLTPAGRKSIMTGTVTVNTQSPKDDAEHTITFVDPLDASGATLVKTGLGTLAFNNPAEYPSQFNNLTVNAGEVVFNAAPTLSGTLNIASADTAVRLASGIGAEWTNVATASDITGPGGATAWNNPSYSFQIVDNGATKTLQCRTYQAPDGMIIIAL